MVRRVCIAVLVAAVVTQTVPAEAAGKGGFLNWLKSKTSRTQSATMPRGGSNQVFPGRLGQPRLRPAARVTARPTSDQDVRRAIAEATQSVEQTNRAQVQQQPQVAPTRTSTSSRWQATRSPQPTQKRQTYFPSRYRSGNPPIRTAQQSAPAASPQSPVRTPDSQQSAPRQPRQLQAQHSVPVHAASMSAPAPISAPAPMSYVMPAGHSGQSGQVSQMYPQGSQRPRAALYPSPVPNVPHQVGMTAITNQALYPHEFLYAHEYKAIYPPYYYRVRGKWAVTPFGVWSHENWKPMGTEVSVKYRSRISPFAGFRPPFRK